MKKLLFTLALMPVSAFAQFEELGIPGYPQPIQPNPPVYGIPLQPVLPVPRDRGPWGTGYSVVTETRERPDGWGIFMGDRDATTARTVTRVVPNDATGHPINGVEMPW
jgi:hypothetical protein